MRFESPFRFALFLPLLLLPFSLPAAAEKMSQDEADFLAYMDFTDSGWNAVTQAENKSFGYDDLPEEVRSQMSRHREVKVIGVVQAGHPNLKAENAVLFRSKNGYKYALLRNQKGEYVAVLVNRFRLFGPNFHTPYFSDRYFYKPELGWGAPGTLAGYERYYPINEEIQNKRRALERAVARTAGNAAEDASRAAGEEGSVVGSYLHGYTGIGVPDPANGAWRAGRCAREYADMGNGSGN